MTNLKKLSAVVLGSLLAIGVGTGVVAHNNNAQATHAAAGDTIYSLNLGAQSSAFGTSNTYAEKTGTVSSVQWKLSLASCQNASEVWIGSNAKNKAKLVLGTGYDKVLAAISGATATSTYYSAMVAQSPFSNIGKVTLNPKTVGGSSSDATKFYLAYSTSLTSNYSLVTLTSGTQGTTLAATGGAVTYEFSTIATGYYAVIFYATKDYTVITPTLTFYEGATGSTATLTDELSLSGSLTNATQYAGRTLDVSGLTIKAVYDDESEVTLTSAQLTLPTLVYGTSAYQISYTADGVTATAMISVTVAQDTAASLSWTGRVTTFNEGSVFTLGTGAVEVTRASGAKSEVELEDLTIYLFQGTFDAATSPVLNHATALQLADNGKSVVLGYEGVYTTASTITVKFVPTTTYGSASGATLVTDVANLAAGDSIVIANIAANTALGPSGGTYRTNVPVTIADNQITSLGSATILTLGGATGAWTLSNGTDFLYFTGSDNTLRTGTSSSSGNTWTIAVTEAGVATVANATTTTRAIKYNTLQPRFSCYTSGQADIAIFKISGGFNYDYILGMLDGDYCTCTLDELDLISTRYAAMTAHEQDYLNSVTIVGKDSNSYTGLEAFNAAMARRAALHAQAAKTSVFGANISDTSVIAIITIISIVGVSAIGGFFYFRKKHLA